MLAPRAVRTVRHGSAEKHLPEALTLAANCPVFAFFDPFGLLWPLDEIASVMNRPALTEVLITFQFAGLRRNAGKALTDSGSEHVPFLKSQVTLRKKMDASLGGEWWQDVWMSGSDDRNDQIYNEYLHRLQKAAGHPGYWSVPITDRWDGPTVYTMILLTKHREGIWHFHEALWALGTTCR